MHIKFQVKLNNSDLYYFRLYSAENSDRIFIGAQGLAMVFSCYITDTLCSPPPFFCPSLPHMVLEYIIANTL